MTITPSPSGTITGPELPVSRISISLNRARITLYFSTPYLATLFVGQLVLTPDASVTTCKGKITPGTDPANGGSCALQVNPSLLSTIQTFLTTHSGLEIALVYDESTLSVSDVFFSSAQSILELLSTHVALLDAHVGVGNVNAELKAVHQTVKEVLDSLHRSAPDSSERGLVDPGESAARHSIVVPRGQKKRAK
jgi:hypothetical protein